MESAHSHFLSTTRRRVVAAAAAAATISISCCCERVDSKQVSLRHFRLVGGFCRGRTVTVLGVLADPS